MAYRVESNGDKDGMFSCVSLSHNFRAENIKNYNIYLAAIPYVIQCAKNYYLNVLMSEHTVTGHSLYNYLTAHHSVTLIS